MKARLVEVLLYVHGHHKDYYSIRDGEPKTATSTFTQLRSSEPTQFFFNVALRSQRLYGTIREVPSTSTSTFTQLLSSEHGCCFHSLIIPKPFVGR